MIDEKKHEREWVSFRVKPGEYEQLENLWKSTCCRSLSEYARKVLLAKPVMVKYRNETADHFLEEMIQLKKELSAIGNNFNQSVRRLHSLDTVPEIKTWALLNESSKRSFFAKVEAINEKLHQIYGLWSQK